MQPLMSHASGFNGNMSGSTPIGLPSMEQFVTAVTDAVQSGKGGLDTLIAQYADTINAEEAHQLLRLVQGLYAVLIPVKPTRQFSTRLKQNLIGQAERTMVERIRYLPPRVQIAAGVALLAGLMILARRRIALMDEPDVVSTPEVAVAQ